MPPNWYANAAPESPHINKDSEAVNRKKDGCKSHASEGNSDVEKHLIRNGCDSEHQEIYLIKRVELVRDIVLGKLGRYALGDM